MPKLGERRPIRVQFVWGSGRKGTVVLSTTDEAARKIYELRNRAVVRRTSVKITYTHRDTGTSETNTFDYTDRLPLRGELGGDTDR